MDFLRYDSDFMMAISKAVDYVLLNILCVLFCIPVVTAGASLTAAYYVSMKLVRKEEPSIWKSFIKSFRENFKQATIIWMLAIFLIAFLAYDWFLLWNTKQISTDSVICIALFIVSIMVILSVSCVFPFLARFQVSTKGAIRNAFWFAILHIPQLLLVIILNGLTYYIGFHYMEWFILIWVIGTGVTLYYASRMFVKEFAKLEPKKEESECEENQNAKEDL